MLERDDLGLSVAIEGVQLIEASAGTGKTFALATLYARLVIERGLAVPSILGVTFTDSAAKELRDRLRRRLALALRIAQGAPVGETDEARSASALIGAAVEREGATALLQRLRAAVEAMDLAPIDTIHGFCRRALSDYPLEAGQPFGEREPTGDERALREEVALEFWRSASRDPQASHALYSVWKDGPTALAKSLGELLSVDELLPASATAEQPSGMEQVLTIARAEMRALFEMHGVESKRRLDDALALGVMNGQLFRKTSVEKAWACLIDWAEAGGFGDPGEEHVPWLGSGELSRRAKKGRRAPESVLFDAIQRWSEARQAMQRAAQARNIALIHEACRYARNRLDALKRERGLIGYDDMIRGVAEALDAPGGERFVDRLRAQYRVALVDEFQDTDPRQWRIFRRLFGVGERALFLIGDPKQAIYRFRGGDVFAYLAAAESADAKHGLRRNFRSRPSLLSAVRALFEFSGSGAFAQEGIEFVPVESGGDCGDDNLRIDGARAPALNFLTIPTDPDEGIEASRERATLACVAGIHALLSAAIEGRAELVDKNGQRRALAPRDIAVLTERNEDAARIQRALAAAGIPCAAVGRGSIYRTEEAQHLLWLLEALAVPSDDASFRAALAAPLFGLDASDLADFDVEAATARAWQDKFQEWRQRALRHGPAALLNEVCAENAARLLTLDDGERRLGNYLQLAEGLQTNAARPLGLTGLRDELERRILDADDDNEEEFPRLESDADRVKILTVHKSKGLEFELVFLPYAATGGGGRSGHVAISMAKHHQAEKRVAVLYPEPDSAADKAERAEERAEKLRLLYVGLTRARLAVWIVWGAAKQAENTPLAWLLHRRPGTVTIEKFDGAAIASCLTVLASKVPGAIVATDVSVDLPRPRLRLASREPKSSALIARRALADDWRVHSFSQWVREGCAVAPRGAEDEYDSPRSMPSSRFSGARFGNSLHAALERVTMAKWLDWTDPLPPNDEREVIAGCLRDQGYASESDLIEGMPLLTRLVADTLNVRLPEGVRLAELPDSARRSEMEFHFSLAATEASALLDALHAHGIVDGRRSFGTRRRLEGLLNGFIDLVYEAGGRYYLLDYKSNRLPGYQADALAQAMRENEYDLQYVLYALALHRWLRFRLGANYKLRRHFGGVRYLFCRGIEPDADASPGIYAPIVSPALIESLDALFGAESAAAVDSSAGDAA